MIMSTKEICKRGLSMTISLTLGNTGFPVGDGILRNAEHGRQLGLGKLAGLAIGADSISAFRPIPHLGALCLRLRKG